MLSLSAQRVLEELFPSQDPIDAVDFDPVEFLNERFPSEQDLEGLDGFLSGIQHSIQSTELEITAAIKSGALGSEKASSGVLLAEQALQDLVDKIDSVSRKAAESEGMVREICRDVKQLDCAKKNLTLTFAALKRLHMLVSAVDQLSSMTNHRQYAECSRLLIAIADFFQYFAEFKDIPKIEALKVSVEESKRLLEESIIEDFKRFSMSSEKLETEALENLQAACVVIDVLGEHAAKSLAEWISKKQLEAFVMIFDVPSEPIHFENFEKRYSWLRRQLQKLMTSFGPIFPKSWNIPGRICLDFSNLAHKHLLKLLSDLRDQKLLDVQLLIRVLQRTIAFEEELDHYYSKVGVVQLYYDLDPDKFDDSGDPNSSELTKRQFRDKKLEQELLTKQGDDSPKAKPMSFSAVPRNMKFKGLISKAFWGFMSIYVELERQNFTKLIDKINREEEWFVSEVKEDRRLSGSDEFFLYIKKSLERCAKFENRKVTFDVYVVELLESFSLIC